MCARFTIDGEVISAAVELTATQNPEISALPPGDVRPTERAVIIAAHREQLHAGLMQWGFPQSEGKGLLINARSESVLEKTAFRESTLSRRCAIPARSFYEWDEKKNQITFSDPAHQVLFFAGIFSRFEGMPRFTILTTAANRTVSRFHDRMPLLLDRTELEPWILRDGEFERYLQKEMPELRYEQPFEQMTLFYDEGIRTEHHTSH